MIKYYTTIVVGPDKKEYDLGKKPFPKREDYIAINAFVRRINKTTTKK